MTVLVGGMRSLGITKDNLGNFSEDTNKLDNEFSNVVLVGHNPAFSIAAQHLSETKSPELKTSDLMFSNFFSWAPIFLLLDRGGLKIHFFINLVFKHTFELSGYCQSMVKCQYYK